MDHAIELLKTYVSYASVSNNPDRKEGMAGAREFLTRRLQSLGFAVELVETPLHPVVLGKRGFDQPGSESWPHVLIYGHYDVQPPEPLELWTSPAFEGTVRGDRLYGRGAADNKGPLIVHTCALENLLQTHPDLPLRITYLVEGEEEIGSPSFHGVLERLQEHIRTVDFILISDTGGPGPDQLVITTALRGLADFEVHVKGPSSDLHSGLYGGAILNPIQALTEICASLHRPDGTINIPGFYDGVVAAEDWERDELNRRPLSEDAFRDFLGVPAFYSPKGYTPMEAIRFQPTLEFNGISGGYQGPGPKTIIPSEASCKITCRLVPDQDPKRVSECVKSAILERAPTGVRVEVIQGGTGYPYLVVPPGRPNSPADMPAALERAFFNIDAAVEKHFGSRPLYLREGGSIPIVADIKKVTGVDSILLGLYTPDDRAHAPDESFHLGIMEKAIPAFEEIFLGIAGRA